MASFLAAGAAASIRGGRDLGARPIGDWAMNPFDLATTVTPQAGGIARNVLMLFLAAGLGARRRAHDRQRPVPVRGGLDRIRDRRALDPGIAGAGSAVELRPQDRREKCRCASARHRARARSQGGDIRAARIVARRAALRGHGPLQRKDQETVKAHSQPRPARKTKRFGRESGELGGIMTSRTYISMAAVAFLAIAIVATAAQHDAKTASLAHFNTATQQYAQLHRQIEQQLPPFRAHSDAQDIFESSNAMASALQTARATAREGDLFTHEMATLL